MPQPMKPSDVLRAQQRQFTRVKVDAKVRLADTRDLPDTALRVQAANKKDEPTYFFQDGVNPDLVYVNFILDSEGSNRNWDFMPRSQLVRSFATCRFKPFDMEHVIGEGEDGGSLVGLDKETASLANSIYGVMTHASLGDANGRILTPKEVQDLSLDDDIDRKPKEKITVVAWAALYNFLFPETVKDVVDAIQDGSMQVSMERWMSDYDFMAWDGNKFAAYDTATASEMKLDENWEKHLVYGGKPVYRRALAYVYGGCASTPNPANAMAKFLGHSEVPTRAVASLDDPVLKALLLRHTEIHEIFDGASAEEKIVLTSEHQKLHLTIAAYTGQEVEHV